MLATDVGLWLAEEAGLPVGRGTDFSVCSTHHGAETLVPVKRFLPPHL